MISTCFPAFCQCRTVDSLLRSAVSHAIEGSRFFSLPCGRACSPPPPITVVSFVKWLAHSLVDGLLDGCSTGRAAGLVPLCHLRRRCRYRRLAVTFPGTNCTWACLCRTNRLYGIRHCGSGLPRVHAQWATYCHTQQEIRVRQVCGCGGGWVGFKTNTPMRLKGKDIRTRRHLTERKRSGEPDAGGRTLPCDARVTALD